MASMQFSSGLAALFLLSGFFGSPARSQIPQIAGDYDTGPRGLLQIHQAGERASLDWHTPDGIAQAEMIYGANPYEDQMGRGIPTGFSGNWVFRPRSGATVRSGVMFLYPDPMASQAIVIESREEIAGSLQGTLRDRFGRSGCEAPGPAPAGPSDDDGFR